VVSLIAKIGLLYFALMIAHYSTHQYLPEIANAIISFVVEPFTIPMILMVVIVWIISLYHLIFKKEYRGNWIANMLYFSATILLMFTGDYLV